ncbi:MAG: sodium:alanine symporter family protein [Chlamydiia bacterium]|nr:sodium:alanine symporter family protein [Chlamydiia bacterium]
MDDLSLFASLFYWTRAVVWGPPLLLLVAATGFYLTWTLKGIQVRGLWPAVRSLFEESSGGHGELSHFQALMTALASAIGTGSIAGVATALALGGAGALFWMWFVAIIGMATSYAESLLSIKYRRVESNGRILGGPMYFLRDGLSAPKLATLFALFACLASFGIDSSV